MRQFAFASRLVVVGFSLAVASMFACSATEDTGGPGENERDPLGASTQAGRCTPTTCAAQGKNCGTIPDGCNHTLNCGTCTSPQSCGGGGVANVCGCTPTTCAAQGKNCGSIPNGCGGTLSCGTCTSPQTCGGNNVCTGAMCPGYANDYVVLNSASSTMSGGSEVFTYNLTNTKLTTQTVQHFVAVGSGSVSPSSETIASGVCSSPRSFTVTYQGCGGEVWSQVVGGAVIAQQYFGTRSLGQSCWSGGGDPHGECCEGFCGENPNNPFETICQ